MSEDDASASTRADRRSGWEDLVVGERMQLDQEFSERVQASRFSSQEWSLIMTAVEFRIEGTGESARIVAETERVESVLPELERVRNQQPMGGGRDTGGVIDSLKSRLGLGGDSHDEEALAAATDLADEYATALQDRLEDSGKWDRVRREATADAE